MYESCQFVHSNNSSRILGQVFYACFGEISLKRLEDTNVLTVEEHTSYVEGGTTDRYHSCELVQLTRLYEQDWPSRGNSLNE